MKENMHGRKKIIKIKHGSVLFRVCVCVCKVTKNVDAENFGQLAFILAYFNNTHFVCMSALETRKSETMRLFCEI